MTITKCYCDRCGKEVNTTWKWVQGLAKNKDYHLCVECYRGLKNYLKNNNLVARAGVENLFSRTLYPFNEEKTKTTAYRCAVCGKISYAQKEPEYCAWCGTENYKQEKQDD